jgi:hypothetical protein
MQEVNEVICSVEKFKQSFFSNKDKGKIVDSVAKDISLGKDGRSLFFSEKVAVRFSYVDGASFSNTVLSLKMVLKYDDRPIVIVVLKPNSVEYKLANTTFINKISHSSKTLEEDNIRGSFNGTDIIGSINGISNSKENFDDLFEYHSTIPTLENIKRIVASTKGIEPKSKKTLISQHSVFIDKTTAIYSSLSSDKEVRAILENLNRRTSEKQAEIIEASKIDNVNIRGNKIEKIITGVSSDHELGDLSFNGRLKISIDIKSKLSDRQSSPKAYNIDKFLSTLLEPNSVLLLYILVIDIDNNTIRGALVSPLHPKVINASRIQHHWAGRNTRGVIQFSGDIAGVIDDNDPLMISKPEASVFLGLLIGDGG